METSGGPVHNLEETVSQDTLAYALPGAFAQLATNGEWQYARHFAFIEDKLLDAIAGKEPRLIISIPPQNGKKISDLTPILTAKGWKTHGSLCVGDYVFGIDGKPTKVIAISESSHLDVALTFATGETIITHENHEWVMHKNRAVPEIFESLHFLVNPLFVFEENGGRVAKRNIYSLPLYDALVLPEKQLPLNPYVLGAWLGDGTTGGDLLTLCPDDWEIISNKLLRYGYSIRNITWHKQTGVPTIAYDNLRDDLRKCGVYDNKHVPIDYVLGSIEQRKEFIAGLIDTDGCWSPTGRQLIIVNTNKNIIDNAATIIRSLGYYVGISKVKPTTSSSGIVGKKSVYYLNFTPREIFPTVVPRKSVTKVSTIRRRKSLVEASRVSEPQLGRCIQVDADDGIYLVGKTLIPTHNSTFVSHYFTAWFLGRHPNKRVILASYEATFAATWGRAARDTLEEYGEGIFGVRVSPRSSAADHWEIDEHSGRMSTAGALGSITGRGADLLIIDDPVKNDKEALSKTRQDNVWSWYRSVVRTRLSPSAVQIVIMTRWAADDLAGRLIKHGEKIGKPWTYICLPALAEKGDVLGRKEGEPLWPERYDKGWLEETRDTLESFWWAALYQQNPAPREGYVINIDWFRRYRTPPNKDQAEQIILSFDTAQKETELTDYTVIGVFIIYDNSYYLVDVIRDRYTHPHLLAVAKNLITYWRPHLVLVEDKGSGTSLIQHLQRETTAAVMKMEPSGHGDKVMRMQVESPVIEAGQVYLPEAGTQPWLHEFEMEVMSFPNSPHKDHVDMLSQFLRWARERAGGVDFW